MPVIARERVFSGKVQWIAALLGAAVAMSGCSKPAKKVVAEGAPSASALATAEPAGVAAPAPTARAPVPRSSLQPPPLVAPADAEAGPGGVRSQLLRVGDGDSPDSVDTIVVDFSMWTADGQLAFSSYPEAQPAAFSVSTLAPNLRGMMTKLKVGSQVRFWVPRAALAGWKPPEWPDTDLVFELELRKVSHVRVQDSSGNSIVPVPARAPDAAGPPKDAQSVPSGLRYIYLAHGEEKRVPAAEDHVDVLATVYVIDGIEVRLLQSGVKTATTLARAPGKLGEILRLLNPGDRVRVWLPAGQGKVIVPEVGQRETILDLAVSF